MGIGDEYGRRTYLLFFLISFNINVTNESLME